MGKSVGGCRPSIQPQKCTTQSPKAPFGAFLLRSISYFYILWAVIRMIQKRSVTMLETKREMDSRYILYHEDGLLDIFIGLGIFFAGLFLWGEMVWMVAIFIPIFMPTFQSARKRFLQPRVGKLDHDPKLQAQSQKILLYSTLLLGVLALAGVGMFFAFGILSGKVNDLIRGYILIILGALFASVWVFAAVMLKLPRFYLYALLTFVPLAAAQYTSLPFWAALSLTGGLVTLIGFVVFIRFLQEHPL
jgi:hypothetical protein